MIDFHTHIFPEKIAASAIASLEKTCKTKADTNGMIDGLARSQKEAGIDVSVILPVVTAPKQLDSINRFASRFLQGEQISFGGIHPECTDIDEKLKFIKSCGFAGIKLHPDYQGVDFNDIRYKRIIACASSLDLTVVTHAGVDPLCPNHVHCTPAMALDVIEDVRPTKLVLAHLGGNEMADEVERVLIGAPVYLDTAVILRKLDKEQFLRIIRNHGTDKVLFATDSPWSSQKLDAQYFRSLPLTEQEKSAIGHENAAKLLHL